MNAASYFIVGLALAAISGLTMLAYKHPEAYRKIHIPLNLTLLAVFVVISAWCFSWDSAISHVFSALIP